MRKDLKNFLKSFYVFYIHCLSFIKLVIDKIISFYGPVVDSVKGVVNPEEFYRVFVLSSTAGGGLYGSIQYLQNHCKDFITDPNICIAIEAFVKNINDKNFPFIIFIGLFLLDYLRRRKHGE